MESLTRRQHTILNGVIETHIDTAQPVGSQFIRQRCRLDSSPATVRNEMGALEDMGYLVQPHTSSGRIPTDTGYRYYVDHCLAQTRMPERVEGRVREELSGLYRETGDPETFMEEASRLLADAAREASLILLPDSRKVRVKLFLQGSSHLLEKPEFQDIAKIRALFRAFEEKGLLMEWLAGKVQTDEVTIRIGQENEAEAFHECAVVVTRYRAGGEDAGTIAIVGPKRMRYLQTIPLVSSMARLMSLILSDEFSE